MDWIAAVLMICSNEHTEAGKADCHEYIKSCVESVYASPANQKMKLEKQDIALGLSDSKNRVKLCK